jgi:hypothetical protein
LTHSCKRDEQENKLAHSCEYEAREITTIERQYNALPIMNQAENGAPRNDADIFSFFCSKNLTKGFGINPNFSNFIS